MKANIAQRFDNTMIQVPARRPEGERRTSRCGQLVQGINAAPAAEQTETGFDAG
jgi:hypothetical protein